jgi:hypothetical protein
MKWIRDATVGQRLEGEDGHGRYAGCSFENCAADTGPVSVVETAYPGGAPMTRSRNDPVLLRADAAVVLDFGAVGDDV